jgi:hypothetical protein
VAKKKKRSVRNDQSKVKRTYENEDLIDYSVFDHITKKNETKNIENNSSNSNTLIYVAILSLVIFVGLLSSGILSNDLSSSNKDNSGNNIITTNDTGTIKPITEMCVDHSSVDTHSHFALEIYLYDQLKQIPANIGVTNTCMRPLHTHDDSNEVHVELTSSYNGPEPTLGNFFVIWEKSFSSSELLSEQGSVSMFVNGNLLDQVDVFYSPKDHDTIQLYLI